MSVRVLKSPGIQGLSIWELSRTDSGYCAGWGFKGMQRREGTMDWIVSPPPQIHMLKLWPPGWRLRKWGVKKWLRWSEAARVDSWSDRISVPGRADPRELALTLPCEDTEGTGPLHGPLQCLHVQGGRRLALARNWCAGMLILDFSASRTVWNKMSVV